jgi:hypothetical protein
LVGSQQQNNLPALRTLSVLLMDRTEIGDGIDLEYGASWESVTFFDRLNYVSPFARLGYDLGSAGRLSVGYSSGSPPVELVEIGAAKELGSDLQQDLTAMSLLPRVSLRGGRAHVQRTENVEIGYEVSAGSRTYTVGVYREVVRNGALTISGGEELSGLDLLPELGSHSSVFNIGGFTRLGYSAAVTQALSDEFSLTLAYGRGGVLRTDGRVLQSDSPSELRGMIEQRDQNWVSARISGVSPWTGTRFNGSYQWTDYRSLTPAHVYFTLRTYADSGMNVRLRQPLPAPMGMPGRIEATAELRNLLAQGYLPITTATGRRMLLTHSPRAVRGGLSFIF